MIQVPGSPATVTLLIGEVRKLKTRRNFLILLRIFFDGFLAGWTGLEYAS
jgi:hypothetical protein